MRDDSTAGGFRRMQVGFVAAWQRCTNPVSRVSVTEAAIPHTRCLAVASDTLLRMV